MNRSEQRRPGSGDRRRPADDVRQAGRGARQLAPRRPAGVRPFEPGRAHRRRPRADRRRHRGLRHPGGGAVHQRHPQRVGGRRPPPDRARHHRRPPVRLVPAGHALRRGRGGRRPLRPGRRVRRRGDEPGARWPPTPGAAPGPFPPSFLEQIDGRLWAQFRVAQLLADRWGISREEMDAYSLESHRRAAAAWDSGHFAKEAIAGPHQGGGRLASPARRSRPTRGSAATARWSRWPASPPAQSWEPDTAPDITAGNSSQTTDGASAMLIAERSVAETAGAPHPGPVLALRRRRPRTPRSCCRPRCRSPSKLLDRSGMKIDEFDAMECNEAFASIALMWQRAFKRRSREAQPEGRGHRHRPPAGGERGADRRHLVEPARGDRRALRLPDDVRGRRPGQRHRHRAARLSSLPLAAPSKLAVEAALRRGEGEGQRLRRRRVGHGRWVAQASFSTARPALGVMVMVPPVVVAGTTQ